MTGARYRDLVMAMDAAARAVDADDWDNAEPLLRRIVSENPRDDSAWHMLAAIACRTGRAPEAVDFARRAHHLARRNHDYMNTLGVALAECGQLDDALQWLRRSLKAHPANAEAHHNLGKLMRKTGDYAGAEQAFMRSLRLDPSQVAALNSLGSLYCTLGRFADALPLLEKAMAAAPDDEVIATNRALALSATDGPEQAEAAIRNYLQRHPQNTAFHFTLALNLLSQGRYAEGWEEYRWRRRVPEVTPGAALAERLPDALDGRNVVLIPEQGLGDQLFFLRFVPILRARRARVLLAASDKLYRLLEGSRFLDGVVPAGSMAKELSPDALWVLLGDLPKLLQSYPVPAPFSIEIPAHRLADWHARLAAFGPPPYLGVTWRAGLKRKVETEFVKAGPALLYKEINPRLLGETIACWGGTVVILQRVPSAEELSAFSDALARPALDLSQLNENLGDMAAVLALLDDYVGVSNTNMHIRAGLGKVARVLVPFPPEFRWMHSGDQSPWFPAFKVYRQLPSRSWSSATDAVGACLSA